MKLNHIRIKQAHNPLNCILSTPEWIYACKNVWGSHLRICTLLSQTNGPVLGLWDGIRVLFYPHRFEILLLYVKIIHY